MPRCRSTTSSARSPASTARRSCGTQPSAEVVGPVDRRALRRQCRAGPQLALRAGDARRSRLKLGETTTVFYKVTNAGAAADDGHRHLQRPAGPRRRLFRRSSNASASPSRPCSPAKTLESRGRLLRRSRASSRIRNVKDLDYHHPSYTYFPVEGRQAGGGGAAASQRNRWPNKRRDKPGGKASAKAQRTSFEARRRHDMAEAHAKHHDYHLVDPSPWPLIGAISAFVMAVGLVMSMKGLDDRRACISAPTSSAPASSASSTPC